MKIRKHTCALRSKAGSFVNELPSWDHNNRNFYNENIIDFTYSMLDEMKHCIEKRKGKQIVKAGDRFNSKSTCI